MDIVVLVQKFGFPTVMVMGLGFFVFFPFGFPFVLTLANPFLIIFKFIFIIMC